MRPVAKSVFLSVCDLEPDVRALRLADLCANDEELRREVERLLEHDFPESIIERSSSAGNPASEGDDSSFGELANDEPDPWLGRTIGNYKLVEAIGRGGMGEVYRARDTRLKRPVAVKFLATHLSRDKRQKRRFLREAQAAAALDHPSICPVYDVGEFEGRPYLVAAYLPGVNLATVVHSRELSVSDVFDCAIQIAEGLAAAHRLGVVHRDMKPGNVILAGGADGKPHVKIIDFGLARINGRSVLTEPGGVIGTAAYIAPEALRGLEIDHRADIWALGVMLYEMLTGVRPFDADERERLFFQICNEEPVLSPEMFLGTPEGTLEIIANALQKDREVRYQNARELIADLTALRAKVQPQGTAGALRMTPAPSTRTGSMGSGSRRTLLPSPAKPAVAPSPAPMSRVSMRRALPLVFAAVVLAAGFTFSRTHVDWGAGPIAAPISRVGVLPFEDLTPGAGEDSLRRGIADALAAQLVGIEGVRVVSSSLVAELYERRTSVRSIMASLRLDFLVTGSIVRSGDSLRTTVTLISGDEFNAVWSKTVELDGADVLKAQKDVTRSVAKEMAAAIAPPRGDRASGSREAEVFLTQGRNQLLNYTNTMQREFLQQAEGFFQRALEEDPEMANASIGMAKVRLLELYPPTGRRAELLSDAREWVDRALSQEPHHPEANQLIAEIYLEQGDSLSGLPYARAAVAEDPGNAEAHERLAGIYSALGFYESSLAEMDKALDLDSSENTRFASQIWHLIALGEFEKAQAAADRLAAKDSESYLLRSYLIRLAVFRGQYDKALEIFAEDPSMARKGSAYVEIETALVRAGAGNVDGGREVLLKHVRDGIRGWDDIILLATVLGDAEAVVKLTRESPYYNSYRWVITNPFISKIKDQQPFRELVYELHKKWVANLEKEGHRLPVLPPPLPAPEVLLGDNRL